MVYIVLVAVVLVLLVYFSLKNQNKSENTQEKKVHNSDSDSKSELFRIALKGVDYLEQDKSTTSPIERFNILIFNTLFLLMLAQKRNIPNYKKVEEKGMNELLNFCLKNQIFKKSHQAKDYINSKNVIFHKELGELNNPSYIPSVIYDAFYENSQSDIIQVTLWKGHLVSMIDTIGTEFDASFN